NGTGSISIVAPITAINSTLADGSGLVYSPSTGFTGSDSLSITINDNGNTGTGGSLSTSGSVNIAVIVPNSPPALSGANTPSYTENAGSQVINSGITVSDSDNSTLSSGRVSIANFVSGQDTLAFANDGATMGNISGTFNSSTGVLTLTSSNATATLAEWQA